MHNRIQLMQRAVRALWPLLGMVARWRRDPACQPALERVEAAAGANDGEAAFQAYLELRAASSKDGGWPDGRG
jgi:hypothetical protein